MGEAGGLGNGLGRSSQQAVVGQLRGEKKRAKNNGGAVSCKWNDLGDQDPL